MPEFEEMVRRGEISPEGAHVLRAIKHLDSRLTETKQVIEADTEARILQVEEDSKHRFRMGLAIIAIVALLITGAGVAYAQYDRVTRCNSRADTIQTIKRVLAKDHDALPDGLLDGFGDNPDTRRVVAVIRAAYDKSETDIDVLLPEPDCSGFLP